MFNIDRHIGISAGWIAGPAFAVSMMAAPEYFRLGPSVSALLFWGGIVVFLATVAVLAFISLHEERKRRTVTGPIILMVLGALIFCGGAAWYFWPGKSEASPEISPLDGAIQITSDLSEYPTILPQHKIFEFQLNDSFTFEGSAFLSWSLPAGAALPRRDPTFSPSGGLRLRISNYGKVALINATVIFPVYFKEIEKTENGIRSGKVIKASTATTNPFSIGAGDFIEIYALNYSTSAFAELMIPQTAQGFAPGSEKQETFKLIPSISMGMGLLPFVPKSPPESPPPVPSAPNKQGKK